MIKSFIIYISTLTALMAIGIWSVNLTNKFIVWYNRPTLTIDRVYSNGEIDCSLEGVSVECPAYLKEMVRIGYGHSGYQKLKDCETVFILKESKRIGK